MLPPDFHASLYGKLNSPAKSLIGSPDELQAFEKLSNQVSEPEFEASWRGKPPITEEEVERTIGKLKARYTAGLNDLSKNLDPVLSEQAIKASRILTAERKMFLYLGKRTINLLSDERILLDEAEITRTKATALRQLSRAEGLGTAYHPDVAHKRVQNAGDKAAKRFKAIKEGTMQAATMPQKPGSTLRRILNPVLASRSAFTTNGLIN